MKKMQSCGIVGYGAYIPSGRLSVSEIASVWKKDGGEIGRSLNISEKAVAEIDEDSVTLSVEAGFQAIKMANIDPKKIGAIYIGSESHPYAVNPSSTIVGDVLGFSNNYMASDMQFACKAGTAGIQVVFGLVQSGKIKYGMAIGADTAQSKPHDVLEYSSGAGAGAYIVSDNRKEFLAEIVDFVSYSSDTPDFWRRDGISYPSHGGRFTGEPAYFTHVINCAKNLLEKLKMKPSDFDYCVFHMPNGKFPKDAGQRLGFLPEQQKDSFLVPLIGNPYSASSLLGLANVLDNASANKKIFMVSYGSGAGADGFYLKTTPLLLEKRKGGKKVQEMIEDKKMISYVEYLKRTRKI